MIPSAIVNGTRPNANEPFYTNREMQIDIEGPLDKVSYMDVPIVERTGYDWPESIWLKGDSLYEVFVEGVPGTPVDNPWHVIRVLPQGNPLPLKVLALAKMDVMQTSVLWLERISYGTPDAAGPGGQSSEATGYDPVRQDEAVLSDESYGAGYNTTRYHGYFPAKTLSIGLLERRNDVNLTASGFLQYEEAEFVVDCSVFLNNEDVLVLPDGRRGTVSQQITAIQLNGVSIGTLYALSIHNQGEGTAIYGIPITQ